MISLAPRFLLRFVLATAFSTGCLVSCRDEARDRALTEQNRLLEELHSRASTRLEKAEDELKQSREERNTLRESLQQMDSELQNARQQLEKMRRDFDAYKQQYKTSIRDRAAGMEFAKIQVGGRTFEEVRLRELTDSSVTFLHRSGTASVRLTELDQPLRLLLGADE